MNTTLAAEGWHFGGRLSSIRRERGLSQRDLGRRMGIPHPQITRWEKQRDAPKQRTLERLAAALEYSVTKLLPGGNEIATSLEVQRVAETISILEGQIQKLKIKLQEVEMDREQLRGIVLEFHEAQQNRTDRKRLERAWRNFCKAAQSIPYAQMMGAVDSIDEI